MNLRDSFLIFSVLATTKALQLHEQCVSQKDGNYTVPDVFKYLRCKEEVGSIETCGSNTLFVTVNDRCIDGTKVTLENFCLEHTNGNYRHPWDCHKFLTCVHEHAYESSCPNGLIYDPENDICNHPGKTTCKQLTNDADCNSSQMGGPGNYTYTDVFKYCHVVAYSNYRYYAKLKDCPPNMIFIPGKKQKINKCVNAHQVNSLNFCEGRDNLEYNDPWNCHDFFVCQGSASLNTLHCPPKSIYSPKIPRCVNNAPCNVVKGHEFQACYGVADSIIDMRNLFGFMSCKSNNVVYTQCPGSQIFDATMKMCIDVASYSLSTICQDRADGNWRNPWNCHNFLHCSGGVATAVNCVSENLVYNPDLDKCVDQSLFRCVEIKQSLPFVENYHNENECDKKPDGKYSIRDVFSYLICKNGHASYQKCPDGEIFVGDTCVKASTQSPKTFCQTRSNGDWQNPWDCHKFFKCLNEVSYEFDCQLKQLVYNPYTDQCVYPQKYSCHQLDHQKPISDMDKCTGKVDGNYTISDVFKYLQCKNGKGVVKNCKKNEIFDARSRKCVNASLINHDNFCMDRDGRDYRDPWDCNQYIVCIGEVFRAIHCPLMLVFYPDLDRCINIAWNVSCNEVDPPAPNQLNSSPAILDASDPCDGKKDGNYTLPDVFKYMTCKHGKSTVHACPANTLFDPKYVKCVNRSKQTVTGFCRNREDGDWQDPWNCNAYLRCSGGLTRVHPCLINGFIYNPNLNVCVQPGEYPCSQFPQAEHTTHQGAVVSKDDLSCAKRKDGSYVIGDVFAYLQCKDHKGGVKQCGDGQIFDAVSRKCVDAKKIALDNFCQDRLPSLFRDPWNCHAFIICDNGVASTFDCPHDLVYNPYRQRCQFAKDFPCKTIKSSLAEDGLQIKDVCSQLPDGNYATRNVFQILQCKNKKSKVYSCPAGKVYIPGDNNCTDSKHVTMGNFCDRRSEGNWQNPWDCHAYLTCHEKQVTSRNCSQFVTLNYNPQMDSCEYPAQYKCQQLRTPEALQSTILVNVCDQWHLPDGNYSLEHRVFRYLQCKNQRPTELTCKKGTFFVPLKKKCVEANKVEFKDFCYYRPNGNWRNPWNCYRYISCQQGITYDRPCTVIPGLFLTYDPNFDKCNYPDRFICQNATTRFPWEKDEPCLHLADGVYPEKDVFMYMSCNDHRHRYHICPIGKYFSTQKGECVHEDSFNPDTFCVSRPSGNWRHPWSCNGYITCVRSEIGYERRCSPQASLNYNPYHEKCVPQSKFPCRRIKSSDPAFNGRGSR